MIGLPLLLAVINLSVHFPYLLNHAFGEPDAARYAIKIGVSYHDGFLKVPGSTAFSIPLYLIALFKGLQWGLFTIPTIPFVMTLVSWLASALLTMSMFYASLLITGSLLAALASAVALQFIPAFWFSSIYGFPSIVSLSLLTMAFVIFVHGWLNVRGKSRVACLAVAGLIFMLAVMTKFDAIFTTPLFLLPGVIKEFKPKKFIAFAALLGGFAVVTYLLHNSLGQVISVSTPKTQHMDLALTSDHWTNWFKSFFHGFAYMYSRANLECILHAFGAATIPALLVACGLVWRKGGWNDLKCVAFIVVATVPLVILWGLFPPNSARHNLIPATLSMLILTYPLKLGFRKSWLASLGLLLVINYFAFAPSNLNADNNPSGNLFASSRLVMRNRTEPNRRIGHYLASLPHTRMAAYKNASMTPFWIFEILSKPGVTHPDYKQHGFFYRENGVAKEFLTTPDNAAPETRDSLKKQGYYVITDPNVYWNIIRK